MFVFSLSHFWEYWHARSLQNWGDWDRKGLCSVFWLQPHTVPRSLNCFVVIIIYVLFFLAIVFLKAPTRLMCFCMPLLCHFSAASTFYLLYSFFFFLSSCDKRVFVFFTRLFKVRRLKKRQSPKTWKSERRRSIYCGYIWSTVSCAEKADRLACALAMCRACVLQLHFCVNRQITQNTERERERERERKD